MYIYHYTSIHHIEPIVEKGMLFGSEIDDIGYGYGTGPINGVLEEYRPNDLPDFVQRDKCIFFYPNCMYRDFGETEIRVNIDKLDKARVYVAESNHAQQIWNDTVDASYSGERSNIPLEVSAKKYWESLVPIGDFIKNPTQFKRAEVLHFGHIPFSALEVGTTLHPLAQRIFRQMSEFYAVERWGSTYGYIYLNEKQFFSLEAHAFTNQVSLRSKSGAIEKQAIAHFEDHFAYQEKKVSKDGNEMTIVYEGVEEKFQSLTS